MAAEREDHEIDDFGQQLGEGGGFAPGDPVEDQHLGAAEGEMRVRMGPRPLATRFPKRLHVWHQVVPVAPEGGGLDRHRFAHHQVRQAGLRGEEVEYGLG